MQPVQCRQDEDQKHGAPPAFQHCTSAYGHSERIFDVQFSPVDSGLIATASEDMTVRLWSSHQSTGDFKQLLCCHGHQAEVMRVAWSADGRFIASGSADKTVRVWQVPDPSLPRTSSYSGQELAVLEGHPEEVYHVELLGGSAAKDVSTAAGLCSERGPGSGLTHASKPLAGRHLLSGSSESLFLWDLKSCTLVGQYHAPGTSGSTVPPEAAMEVGFCHAYIYSCAHQPGRGPLLVCACNDGVLRFWALQTKMDAQGQTTTQLRYRSCKRITQGGGPNALVSAVFDSSGRRLAVAARDGRVLILDLSELQEAYTAAADAAALRREPNLYLLSHFQAPSKPFGLANLPCPHPKATRDINSNDGCNRGRMQKGDKLAGKRPYESATAQLSATATAGAQGSRRHVDGKQHAEQGGSQRSAERSLTEPAADKFAAGLQGHDQPECSRALLIATVDGRVLMYDWDNPAEGHCILSHPIQQQQQQQQHKEGHNGTLPALYAVAASSHGDAIAAAGQASILQGPPLQGVLPPSQQLQGARNGNLVLQSTEQQATITLFPPSSGAPKPPEESTDVQHQRHSSSSAAAAAAAAAIAGSAPRLRRPRRSSAATAAAAAASAGIVLPQQHPWELQSEGADQSADLRASQTLHASHVQGAFHGVGPDLISAEQVPPSISMAYQQKHANVGGPRPEAGLAFSQGRQGQTEEGHEFAAQPELATRQQDDTSESQLEIVPGIISSGHPGAQRSGLDGTAKHTHASTGSNSMLRAPILIWSCNSLLRTWTFDLCNS